MEAKSIQNRQSGNGKKPFWASNFFDLEILGEAPLYLLDGTQYWVGVAEFTPESAKEILLKQKTLMERMNRAISKTNVDKLSHRMGLGHWKLNGEPIIFDDKGLLMDGQHRLAACARTNVPLISFFVYGIKRETFDTLDGGKARTIGDVYGIEGKKNYNALAAMLTLIYAYTLYGEIPNGIKPSDRPDKRDLDDLNSIEAEEALEWARQNRKYCPAIGLQQSVAAFLMWLLQQKGKTEATRFMESVLTGEGLTKGMPELALRNLLINSKDKSSSGSRRIRRGLGRKDMCFYFIKAWNFRRNGSTISTLKIGPNERFPKPI